MATLKPLEPLGVEAVGYDLRAASPDVISQLAEAMLNTGMGLLVVRNQQLDPPALQNVLEKFAPHFGQPVRYEPGPGQSKGVPGCPSLSVLGNYSAKTPRQFGMDCQVGERIGEFKPASNAVDEWHTEGSFLMQPKVAIALYAPDIGDGLPVEGGETRFASCTRAWEALPSSEQRHVSGCASVHSWEVFMRFLEARDPARPKVTAEDCAKKPDVVWPFVRTHPRTGRHSLFVEPKTTRRVLSLSSGSPLEGMSDDEGVAFTRKLAQKVIESGVYAHFWRRGDFAIWDNRVLLHADSAFDADRYECLLFRAEFPGEPVVFRPDMALLESFFDSKETFPAPYTPWDFHLPCNPATVVWGYLDAAPTARLTVPSGAVIRVDTINGGPDLLPPVGGAPHTWRLLKEYKLIHEQVTDRLGNHILTGPIAVENAEPGDVLQIDILEVRLRSNWAWTMVRPYGGALGLAKAPHLRHSLLEPPPHLPPTKRARRARSGASEVPLGLDSGQGENSSSASSGWARPAWGGRLPLRPFFGVIGVAPPPSFGRQHSIPPRDEFGGNIDLKELTAGSTLYLTVRAPGAQLFVGDGHGLQGDGECCGTALETALSGVFRLVLHKKLPDSGKLSSADRGEDSGGTLEGMLADLPRPRAVTPTELITMAFHHSFDEAAKLALADMLDWLTSKVPRLARQDAYCLLSVAADVRVTQLVNHPQRGAHVVLQKRHIEELAKTGP